MGDVIDLQLRRERARLEGRLHHPTEGRDICLDYYGELITRAHQLETAGGDPNHVALLRDIAAQQQALTPPRST